ncbi:MAG TPA: hypothetical protein PLD47_09585 [Aggregatilineales bacterium]|nr:hypothetical protein [Anaerolineales bacterium]HRE47964.1 hypothetical protein [Aggregatilineales bacterium]
MTTTITPPTADPNETLLTLLAEHADALAAGNTSTLLEVATLTLSERALFGIAEALHRALPGVEPNPEFLAKLRRDLLEALRAEKRGLPVLAWLSRWRNLPTGYRIAAGVGGLTIAAGLTLLGVRRVIDAAGKIAPSSEGDPALALNPANG